MDINVLQYNAFLRPYIIGHDGQLERMELIPSALCGLNGGDIDAITLCEVDFPVDENGSIRNGDQARLTRKLLDQFKDLGFAYHAYHTPGLCPSPDRSFGQLPALLNGGVMIVSKWPIKQIKEHGYSNCSGSDCAAAKGVMYAEIEKTDGATPSRVHLFATHMQAWYSPEGIKARGQQAVEFRKFIDSLNIPSTDPVILTGDLNVDLVHYPDEFDDIIKCLGAVCPQLAGDQRFSSDPSSNLLVGLDGAAAADDCEGAYKNSWMPRTNRDVSSTVDPRSWGNYYKYDPDPARKTPSTDKGKPRDRFFTDRKGGDNVYLALGGSYCPCCPHEWLDYVLYSENHRHPLDTPTLACIPLKATQPFEIPCSGKLQPEAKPKYGDTLMLTDLSDHYPVIGHFTF